MIQWRRIYHHFRIVIFHCWWPTKGPISGTAETIRCTNKAKEISRPLYHSARGRKKKNKTHPSPQSNRGDNAANRRRLRVRKYLHLFCSSQVRLAAVIAGVWRRGTPTNSSYFSVTQLTHKLVSLYSLDFAKAFAGAEPGGGPGGTSGTWGTGRLSQGKFPPARKPS